MLDKLLPEISAIIIRRLLDIRIDTTSEWKSGLNLLAICRAWRLLALPQVYSYVIVQSSEASTPPLEEHGAIDRNPEYAKIVSNISLATELGHTAFAKRLLLSMDYNMGLALYLQQAIQVLQHYPELCAQLTELKTYLQSDVNPKYWSFGVSANEITTTLANQLCKQLPSIEKVNEVLINCDGQCRLFKKIIVTYYSQQLTYVNCCIYFDQKHHEYSKRITHLCIVNTSDNDSMPRTNIDHLEEIKVHDLVLECSKANFYSESHQNSGMFVFNALKFLCLKNSGSHVMNMDMEIYKKMHFPSLRTLVLNLDCNPNKILADSHFPDHLDKLIIRLNTFGRLTLYNIMFGASERKLIAHIANNENQTSIRLIKFLNKIANRCTMSRMMLCDETVNFISQHQQITCLHQLELCDVDVHMLACILPYVKSLRKLTVYRIAMGDNVLNESMIINTGPLNDTVEHIELKNVQDGFQDVYDVFYKNIALRLPALKWITAPVSTEANDMLVEKYSHTCPHISSITIFYR